MFTYEALNGRALPVHGDGHQTRTFCYITDAISGFLKTLIRGRPRRALQHRKQQQRNLDDVARQHVLVGGAGRRGQAHLLSGNLSGRRATTALPRSDEGREGLGIRVEGGSAGGASRVSSIGRASRRATRVNRPSLALVATIERLMALQLGLVGRGRWGPQYRANAPDVSGCFGRDHWKRCGASRKSRRRLHRNPRRHSRRGRAPLHRIRNPDIH